MCFLATAAMQQAVYSGTDSGNNQNTLRYCCELHLSNCYWFVQCWRIACAILKIGFSSPGKVEKNFIKSFGTLSHFDLLAKLSQCVKFGILTTNLNTFSLNYCTTYPQFRQALNVLFWVITIFHTPPTHNDSLISVHWRDNLTHLTL